MYATIFSQSKHLKKTSGSIIQTIRFSCWVSNYSCFHLPDEQLRPSHRSPSNQIIKQSAACPKDRSNSKLILSSTNSWHFRCFLCLLVYNGLSFIKSTVLELAKAAVNLVNIHQPKFQLSPRVGVFDSRGWPKFKLSILVIILLCGNLFLWICVFSQFTGNNICDFSCPDLSPFFALEINL